MIKVNLYPEARDKAKKSVGRKVSSTLGFLPLLGIITVAAAVLMTGAVSFLKMHVSDLKDTIEANKKTLMVYQQKGEEVKRYEKLNAEYAQKSGVIELLRSNQSLPVKILAELSGRLPHGIWLTNVTYKGDLVSIEGYGFTTIEIVNFVESLRKAPNFSEVSLIETRESEYHQATLYKFNMSVKAKA